MSCIEYGFAVQGDVNQKLAKSVDFVAGSDFTKAQILVGYFGTKEFQDYIAKETGESDVLKVNANTLRRLLESYFVARHNSITNSVNKKNADALSGFTSAKAKSIAKDHSANLIIDTYYSEVSKPKGDRMSNKQIINNVSKRIGKVFNNEVVAPFIAELNTRTDISKVTKDNLSKVAQMNNQINDLFDEYDNLMDDLDNADESTNENAINTRLDEIDEQLDQLENDRYIVYQNLITDNGNIRQKNYANLVSKVRGNPNEWYADVFTISKLVNIANEFEITLENDKLNERNYVDENDVINNDSEGIDEMAKSWEDSLYKSFDRHINADMKLYLNRIYKLSSPAERGSNEYNYDTNNELGVPVAMGSNFIIAQLSNYGTFYSVDDFINSVDKAARLNPNLYGLSKIVNDMIANREFANYVMAQVNNPKIAKTMVTVAEDSINFDQSNSTSDPLGYVTFNLLNSVKANFKSNFTVRDITAINDAKLKLSKVKSNNIFLKGQTIKNLDAVINSILNKYFPKIDTNAVQSYLASNKVNAKETYEQMLNNLSTLVNGVESVVNSYNAEQESFRKSYASWANERRNAYELNESFNDPMPVFDHSNVNYNPFNAPIIELAKKLVNYSAIKNELNTTNAEGNMASDLIGNNFITNFIKQIQYGNESDINAGLERYKEFVTKSPQLQHSTLLFGVKDSKGRTIVPGLFDRSITGEVTVNPNAKNLISMSLFDGIKDRTNSNAAMYSGMSPGDYFLTQMIAFNSPISQVAQSGTGVETAGYFMRTPSDAPKNFIFQGPKFETGTLWRLVNSSRTGYIDNYKKELANRFAFNASPQLTDISYDIIDGDIKGKIKNNNVSALEMYDMFNNPIQNRSYGSLYNIVEEGTDKVLIPMVYNKNGSQVIMWIEGDKVQDATTNIIENVKVREVFTNLLNAKDTVLPDDFLIDISEQLTRDGVERGDIVRSVNRDNPAFRALYSNVLGELTNFVNNLNNVFYNDNGTWTVRQDTDNLVDRYHYNGNAVFKDGVLTGNVFRFDRLFESNGYKADTEIKTGLFLYGQGNANSLIRVGRNGQMTINTDRNDLIRFVDNRIELNLSAENDTMLNDVVEQWLNNYYFEILNRLESYSNLLEDRYSNNDVVEYAINNAITEMSFDDVFEGDFKFYKGAQDFLKRTKEVQAAGKAYTGFDFANPIGGAIKDIVDNTGSVQPILINGEPVQLARRGNAGIVDSQLNARNGFHGVTIINTVRPSANAANIKNELVNILTSKVGKDHAERIATEIAKGYFENTKVNDAQSYITLEEFIARRYADGTLNEYQGLLSQLLDDNVPIENIDLKGVNARIQVQKNFYFDKQYDENTGTYYPRQIKNAEFVLIPKLIKGTELETLYNIMKANDVNQVNTVEASKAAKKNTLTFWDENGVAHPESFDASIKANNGIAIENYYYQYLYKQQDVADHMVDEKNKAGIQIMKKIIDNADNTVRGDIDNFFKSYVANIRDDFQTLLVNMGWKEQDGKLVDAAGAKNADGNPVLRFEEFYKKARIEAQRLGMDSNFIEYLTPDELGDPRMPNYMNNVSSKLESIAQSIFNNGVTRQTLPGWHGAQVTSVGHGAQTLDSNGEFRELRYHPKKDINVEINNTFIKYLMARDGISENEAIKKLKDNNTKLITVYRGQGETIELNNSSLPDHVKGSKGRWFTKDKSVAESYARLHNGKLYAVSIPESMFNELSKIIDGNYTNGIEALLPKELVDLKVDVDSGTQEAYAEIMIPRWSKLIPKDYDISKLAEEGLDIHLGYRIPTEGKQSVSILKVVGFLDEIYGSTIMVPDEWVTQTGSDFDVDSVYGISYEIYKDKKGNIKKVKFDDSLEQKDVERRYISYVNSALNKRVDKDVISDEFVRNKLNDLRDSLTSMQEYEKGSKYFRELLAAENDLYQQLPINYKQEVKSLNNKFNGSDIVDKFNTIANIFRVHSENETDTQLKDMLEEFADYNEALAFTTARTREYKDTSDAEFKSSKAQAIAELYEQNRLDYLKKVKEAAKEANLLSYDQFASQSIEDQNTRRARNNRILDSMVNIMNNPNSREENYSRSNFDDLTNSMKKMDALRGASSIVRSPYNPFDQIDFMNNAMSGATLKAFSVTRDTFNSVNNYTKTRLGQGHEITVEYSLDEYNVNDISAAYDNVEVDSSRGVAKVVHNRIANSKNNRNVVGKLLTVYSSQTTAHILDAVKEGTIYNENDYTFGTFKTLVDIGIDYDTSIAFLMQPGISRIVDAYFENKSIYTNNTANPISIAIKRVARDLGVTVYGNPVDDFTRISNVILALSNNGKLQMAYSELFNANLSTQFDLNYHRVALNGKMLQNRLNGVEIANNSTFLPEDKVYRDAAFDLAMIVNFDKYRNTTLNIEALARVSNPDRFGAKQTIRSTRKTKDNIIEYANNPNNPIGNTLLVGDKSIISSLYPNVGYNTEIDIERSSYPYLAAFLKYATIPSIEANGKLFPTESDTFNNVVDSVQFRINKQFNDEQYKEFKQYMISDVYAGVPFLTSPLTLNEFGLITLDSKAIQDQMENNDLYWDAEKARIFGYDVTQSSSLEVADINNPTAEEIDAYNKLTPAQKVMWIQRNFNEGRGIFEYLDVNTFNQYEFKNKGFTSQSIRYSDQIDDVENMYVAFKDSFFNKNPLVRLGAIDLIKYAFVVEGFKFKKGGISKIITNDALYSNLEDKGINLIDPIKRQFNFYNNPLAATTKTSIDKFIRSHSELVKEVRIPKPAKNKQGIENIGTKFARLNKGEGIIVIPFNESYSDLLEHLAIQEDNPKDYVRISKTIGNGQRRTTLYKLVYTPNGMAMYPLNLLERNETSLYSINPRNNIYKTPEYYESIINKSVDNGVEINELLADENEYETIQVLKEQFTITPHKTKHVIESVENMNEIIRIVNHGTQKQSLEATKFINDINNYLTTSLEDKGNYGVIRNDSSYINSMFPDNTSVLQNIPDGDTTTTVKISKYTKRNGLSKDFGLVLTSNPKANISKVKVEEVNALNEAIDARSQNPTLYKIEIVTNESDREIHENDINANDAENKSRMDAITNIIEDVDVDLAFDYTDSDKVAKDMYNNIYRRTLDGKDKYAIRFNRVMDIAGVDRSSSNSINKNKANIYNTASYYYTDKSNELIDKMDNFTTVNGETYSIDDPALYKHLTQYKEDYPALVKLILEAKTFGDQFSDIFNLNLVGEDKVTSDAITKIRNSINKVNTSSKLKNAVNLLFNDYIANNYSTNPNVRNGLIDLKTAFGDTDWFDLNFSDIGELNHKQVQTVVKYVNTTLNEATKVYAPQNVKSFTKQFDSIMNDSGTFNWDNIITKEGKFINPYTDQFLEDRQKVIDDLKIAEETHGIDSIEYANAKLNRDRWRLKNVQQEILPDYYAADVELRSVVLKNAPKEYVQYMKLIRELYSDKTPFNLLTKEEKDRRYEINNQIRDLMSDLRVDGSFKNDAERFRTAKLRQYIEAKKRLNGEYFEYNETDGFRDSLKHYTTIIQQYNKKNPLQTLDQKLLNEDYKEAHDWIKTNTNYTLNQDAKDIVTNAFKTLKSEDNINNSTIKKIIQNADAYDEFGNIDPRKLSKEDIAKIKKLTEHKFSWTYDSNAGEAVLIKEVPAGLPVLTDNFYRQLRDPSENDSGVNARRLKVIGEINALLGKALDINTGAISTKDLFTNLSEEELNQLANLYMELKGIKSKRSKESKQKFIASVDFKTNDAAFNREFAYAQNHLKGTKQYDTWLKIFTQVDKDGNLGITDEGVLIPNDNIYGYVEPKDKTYIDQKKTDARKVIENDIEFVPTEYYYQAMADATAQGRFQEWYKENHIFNPYTHKVEPLKVWTTMEASEYGQLKGSFDYVPTYENTERSVKDEYVNPNYKRYSTNYNIETGQYNNLNKLSTKEYDMLQLLKSTINSNATTHSMKMFAEKGFLPRRAKYTPDARWYVGQTLGTFGLEFRNTGEKQWTDKMSYVNDFDADFDMMSIIKRKGYKPTEHIDSKGTYESDTDYAKRVEAIRERNKQIEAENLKLDNEVLDRDWKSVFQDFIEKATEYNAKQKVKNTMYLLLEDLKDTKAYKRSSWNGDLKIDNARSTTENTQYQTIDQTNTHAIVENWIRRVLFNQFKKASPYSKWADLAQNITSAKYMIANVTGGIANVATGLTNIAGEVFASDYFGNKHFTAAQRRYIQNSLSFISDMYSDTSNNLTVAIAKAFDIVDFDAFVERRPDEKASERVKRVRDALYSMQSGGEHYMQNSVLFAMLKSHRVFKDTDGTDRVGSISNYNWEVEMQTLMSMLQGRDDLLIRYKTFIKDIKNDLNELKKYDTFTKDFNEEFLRDTGDKALINDYIAKRKEALAKAKQDFKTFPLAEDQFEVVDGHAVIKEGSPLTTQMFGELRNKVISVNKRIHGVYDKIGAAGIEKEWWGGLVMQYHKHIYPGIMKRYRTKGYYNESRNSIERGSYISLANYLATEFSGLNKRVKNRVETDNENVALASIKEVIKASVDTVLNFKMNYQLMPVWEQNNVRRSLGDLLGVTSAFLLAIGIHLMTDDDEIKDSELLSTVLYLTDRINSESSMYTPWGLYGEAGTLWSSPIAAQNGPKDLIKGLGIGTSILFDDEYNPYYTTGLYKDQHKGAVLLYRNTPIYRAYQRLSTMTRNNNYYRINENALNIKYAKAIADGISPE